MSRYQAPVCVRLHPKAWVPGHEFAGQNCPGSRLTHLPGGGGKRSFEHLTVWLGSNRFDPFFLFRSDSNSINPARAAAAIPRRAKVKAHVIAARSPMAGRRRL